MHWAVCTMVQNEINEKLIEAKGKAEYDLIQSHYHHYLGDLICIPYANWTLAINLVAEF